MKKAILAVAFLAVFFIVGTPALAVQINWEVKQHDDPSKVLDEMTKMANQGYAPLGLSVRDEAVWVLYVKGTGLEMTSIAIRTYGTPDEIKTGVTKEMEDGYIPTGMSIYNDKLHVVYIKSPNSATAWQLVTAGLDLQEIKKSIDEYTIKRYYPIAVTMDDDTFYTLLVKTKKTSIKSWSFNVYEANQAALVEGINGKIEEGYLPWGMTYRGNNISILYVGFE